jgi:hypothetical protein
MQENGSPQASTIKYGGNVIRDLTCYAQSLLFDFYQNTQNSTVAGEL